MREIIFLPLLNRTRQWWQPKTGNILAAVYLAVFILNISFEKTLIYILPTLVTILGIGLFGHLINDWADLSSDQKVGKKNMLSKLSVSNKLFFLFLTIILAVSPWTILPYDQYSLFLLGLEFLLFCLYALRPFRIKTRGFIALVFDSLYAYVIPFLLMFHTFTLIGNGKPDIVIYLIIIFWQLCTGVYNILIHQIEDYENDLQTNTSTWVVTIGKVKARKFLLLVFWSLMLFGFAVFIGFVSLNIWHWYFILPALYLIIQFGNVFYNKPFNAFVKSNLYADLQKVNIHYHLFLPYWHLLILVFFDFKFIFLLGIHLILFFNKRLVWIFKNAVSSYLVNYVIYYFRIFILFQTAKIARREYYEEYSRKQRAYELQRKLPNIAVVNYNKSKYTETFIKNHIDWFKKSNYFVHQLYGGYLPEFERNEGNLISNSTSFKKFLTWYEEFFGLGDNYFLKKAIKNYLMNKNIQIVIAEFGQCGAEMAPVCEEAGVPLIVYFLGYDAHHQDVLSRYKEKYLFMFKYASAIVCVSKEIATKLETLGAPKKSLVYLPCAFDLDKFQYSDHSSNPPVFIAVGRFSETKSPHLTILAFNEVLNEIPNAQLIMVGKDGGGELFEACNILVKALKIEERVIFKGILTHEVLQLEMRKTRVFVQHSLTTPLNEDKEGTPVSVMEAMATGLPVVATRHAGIAELIQSGESGILVDEYDYLGMAKAMFKLCKSNDLVSNIGRKASESIRNNELIVNNKEVLLGLVERYRLK